MRTFNASILLVLLPTIASTLAADAGRAAQDSVPALRGAKPEVAGSRRPNRDLQALDFVASDPTGNQLPLGQCQGDCDGDGECASGLVCFQKARADQGGPSTVPGCAGTDTSHNDFCIDPADLNGGSTTTTAATTSTTSTTQGATTTTTTTTTTTSNGDHAPINFQILDSKPAGGYGLCQGDCDNNGECAGSLECYERDPNTAVPGCLGTPGSRTDFCAPPGLSGGGGGATTSNGGTTSTASTTSTTNNGNGGGGSTPPSGFNAIRLYWEQGYYWQETYAETFWCIGCRQNNCSNGNKMYIDDCRSHKWRRPPAKFRFEKIDSDEFIIRLQSNTNLCWERSNMDIYLRNCNQNNPKQQWSWNRGGLGLGEKFELTQVDIRSKCVTQRHHPKYDEEVEIESCRAADVLADTSYWEWWY